MKSHFAGLRDEVVPYLDPAYEVEGKEKEDLKHPCYSEISDENRGNMYLAALNAALHVIHVCICVSRLSRERVLFALSSSFENGWLGILKATFAARNSRGFDSINDSRALRRHFYVLLMAAEKHDHGYDDGTSSRVSVCAVISFTRR